MRSYGNNSRAIIAVGKGRVGYVFIAENKGGKIIYVDPQVNGRYTGLNLSKVTSVEVIRIDNQQFTDYAKNAFTRQKV